jgi:hypothetical protein
LKSGSHIAFQWLLCLPPRRMLHQGGRTGKAAHSWNAWLELSDYVNRCHLRCKLYPHNTHTHIQSFSVLETSMRIILAPAYLS